MGHYYFTDYKKKCSSAESQVALELAFPGCRGSCRSAAFQATAYQAKGLGIKTVSKVESCRKMTC